MGISDDIKPKSGGHSGHHHYSHDDHLFDDLDDLGDEKPVFHPQTEHRKEEYESREDLEDEFFTGNQHKTHTKENHDFYREEPEHEKEQPHHRKHKSGGRFAKVLIWIMVLTLSVLLVWQNRSDIKSLVAEKVFKAKDTPSPVEQVKPDDYYAGEATSNSNANTNSTVAAANTNSASTAAAPSGIDKAGVKIEILNGNGIANSGAKLKSDLVAAGFTVSKTANAKNFNYATTLIYYKTGKSAEADTVKSTITGRDITVENNDTLAGAYDVVIVLGAK